MSDFTHKENTGTMFINKYKETDRHPDLKGEINIAGEVIKIAGWKKQTKNGEEFISLSADKPEEKDDNTPF